MRARFAPLAITALAVTTAQAQPPMSEAPHALSLRIERTGDAIAVELLGHSPRALQVSYVLDVTGRSTSRHRGTTTLAANTPVRLSTMTASVDETWCVRLLAEEDGSDPYEIIEGDCPETDA